MKLGDANIRTSLFHRDIEMARRVHVETLPRPFADERLEFGLTYRNAVGLGGDHAIVERLKGNRVFVAVSDVTGHGIAAAMMVGRISTFVRAVATETKRVCHVIHQLQRFVAENFGPLGMFVTFASLVYDPKARTVTYSAAGHPPGLLVRSSGSVERLNPSYPMLGIEGVTLDDVGEQVVPLAAGDLLTLYTDGVTESRPPNGEFFGLARLEKLLQELRGSAVQPLTEEVARRAEAYTEGPLKDDVLVAALRAR